MEKCLGSEQNSLLKLEAAPISLDFLLTLTCVTNGPPLYILNKKDTALLENSYYWAHQRKTFNLSKQRKHVVASSWSINVYQLLSYVVALSYNMMLYLPYSKRIIVNYEYIRHFEF